MKLKTYFFEIWIFLLSRSPVYFLSFISYREFLFNLPKIYKILNDRIIKVYLEKYFFDVVGFISLILFIILFKVFTSNKIKNSTTTQEKIISIKKIGLESQIDYLATFLLPLIAGFQKVNLFWIIFYEIFIFIIIRKNMNQYLIKVYSILFKEYVATLENNVKVIIFSNKEEEEIKEQIGKDSILNSVNIYNDILSDKIFFY